MGKDEERHFAVIKGIAYQDDKRNHDSFHLITDF